LRKQCENSGNNAKTPLNHNYFLRFSKKIFPDFWPQATQYLAAGHPIHRPQAEPLSSAAGRISKLAAGQTPNPLSV
jgi:hypothetical protein